MYSGYDRGMVAVLKVTGADAKSPPGVYSAV